MGPFKSKITKDVLAFFFLQDQASLYVNEISRRLHLDSGNLARKLIQLEKEGILKSERKGKQRYYCLNPSFPFLKEYKKIVMATFGFEHLLREALGKVGGITEAYIFGSYVEGRMDALSDVDVLAIGVHKPLELHKQISELQKATDREINVVSLRPEEYKEKRRRDPFIKSIVQKGMIPVL